MPLLLFSILMVFFSTFWYYVELIDGQQSKARLETISRQLTSNLEVFSADRMRALRQISLTIQATDEHLNQTQLKLAKTMVAALPGIKQIALIDDHGMEIWSTSSLSSDFDFFPYLKKLHSDKNSAELGYFNANANKLWLSIKKEGEKETGYLLAEFELSKILGAFLSDIDSYGLAYRLSDEQSVLASQRLLFEQPIQLENEIKFAGRIWRLEIATSLTTQEWREIFLVSGTLLSTILSFLYYFFRKNNIKLTESEQKYRRLVENIDDHFFYSQLPSGDVSFVSESVLKLFGYSPKEFSKEYRLFSTVIDTTPEDVKKYIDAGSSPPPYLVEIECKNGATKVVEYRDSIILDENGKLIAIEGVGRDITEEYLFQKKIAYQADHDQLTGLYNRYAFDRLLTELNDTPAVLCYIDMDKFKLVNDSCGHSAGDLLLKNIASIITTNCKPGDILARLGGDEFALIMLETNIDLVKTRLKSLLQQIESFRFNWNDRIFSVGASIGVVPFCLDRTDINTLVQTADICCYTAKAEGNNRFYIGSLEDTAKIQQKKNELNLVEQVQLALENNSFELHFQTIKPLKSDDLGTYYEVLLRLYTADGANISPAVFIPAAERYGLMQSVDRWVFDNTLLFLSNNPEHLQRLTRCSINLSGQSIGSKELLEHILHKVDTSLIPANKLCFEITETSAVTNMALAVNFIKALRDMGCFISLDDFGSGMCSFSYLKHMPVDYVKIDGSFVRNMANDKSDFAMVKAIHDIAVSLGKTTVAEFVSDAETVELLTSIGVDFAQGFFIAKPEPLTA